MNLSDLIDRNAAFTPEKDALRYQGASLSYAALSGRIGATAAALSGHLGVRPGDRVAILSANHPDYLVLLFACARLGAMLVPLNWRLAAAEQRYILEDAGARTLVVQEAFNPVCGDLPQAMDLVGLDHAPDGGRSFAALLADVPALADRPSELGAPLLIVYTSGTTGRPKGAVLTQQALLTNAMMSQHMHAMTTADHVLTVLPFFHVGGLNIQTTPALQLGATVTLHPRFAPDAVLDAFARERPSLTVLVPATMQAAIEHPRWRETDITCLRALTTGSTQVPQALVEAFTARGVPVLQVYGSTETCPVAVYTRAGGDQRAGSTGLPGLVCEARVVDDAGEEVPAGVAGEVVVRGPNVFFEYWGNASATAETLRDGWYRSGDIGTRDADGHFFIHDRKKNMIISGAENIYPAEVERVLIAHPDVAEAAVIGRADPKWQEVP
ncbi:MAG TPA: AMP-binding protein, partial [Acetobacteraceae bacterium]|nr:AMP-binding protein [Acetobacteraceae bacterium]